MDKLKQIPARFLEIWKSWSRNQKIIIVSAVAVFIAAVVVIAVVLSRPTYQELTRCEDYNEMNTVTSLLTDNGYTYQIDNMAVKVKEQDLTNAKMLIASNDIKPSGYSLDDALNSSLTTTESDKNKKYAKYLETKFENDIKEMSGKMGIGCISDNEPQPLLINCRLGSYAIVSVGRVANMEELIQDAFDNGHTHFLEMSGGEVNQTELIAAMINQKDTYVDGIINVLRKVKGSISFMLMTKDGLYLVRDKLGRTPLNIGKGENGFCASFESHAYINLGYSLYKELGPGEVCFMTSEEVKTLVEANDKMKICSFLWVYYGYPTSCYEGRNVEEMRYECGRLMAQRDDIKDIDLVAGVPDSGIAHAIGYSNESHIQYGRPFIKYTPTWPRSFMPQIQADRNLIAKMKLIPIASLIKGKSLLLIDDSIVRGTQLRDTTEYLYDSGARAVHIRPACPPIMYGCPYLNFSRSTSDMDLITRRVIKKREGENDINMLETYSDPDTPEYNAMVEEIRKELNFTSLRFNRLDYILQAIGLDSDKICTYCFNGKK